MTICLIHIKIEGEPIFPRTEERLHLQAKEAADYMGLTNIKFRYAKDRYSFGFFAEGQLDNDIKVVITYPNAIEEDDDWNEIIPDDRYNLYLVFDVPFEDNGLPFDHEDYYKQDYEGEYYRFCQRLRRILKGKFPVHYHLFCKHKGIHYENFMDERIMY